MLRTRFTTRGDHKMSRDMLHAFGNIPRLHGAVARLHSHFRTLSLAASLWRSRDAMRLVSLVLLATAAFGQTYNASIFAGVWLPENLPGASVSLNQIGGVAVDAAGNVFLSLPQYAAVMRLDTATGILTRVAGNASNGFSGDNGPAINAQLYGPNGLALDPAGNLYIADTDNRRIRKVSNGIITTVAGNGVDGAAGDGGPAGSAELSDPYALAIDAAGNLYIGDDSGVIRKVTNGVIASVAGAQGYFVGIAVNTAGNLYLVDGITPRVLKVSNGVAAPFAGDGTYGFSGDNGPATAPSSAETRILTLPSASPSIPPATSTSPIRTTAASARSRTVSSPLWLAVPPPPSWPIPPSSPWTSPGLSTSPTHRTAPGFRETASEKSPTASSPPLPEMATLASAATTGRPPTRSSSNPAASPSIPPAGCTSPTRRTTVSA